MIIQWAHKKTHHIAHSWSRRNCSHHNSDLPSHNKIMRVQLPDSFINLLEVEYILYFWTMMRIKLFVNITKDMFNIIIFVSLKSQGHCAYDYLASETLILQPPEKCLVGLSCISLVNPKPARIRRALGSAESTPCAFISS